MISIIHYNWKQDDCENNAKKMNGMGRGGGTVSNRKNFWRTEQKKIRIVVVDDDHDMVDTLSTLLEVKGVEVIGKAYDGEEAYQQYVKLKPDVVLLDLDMPNYDGHYTIEKIKQEYPNARIIVISAYLDKHFEPNKVLAVFSKPYDVDKIVNKIKEITNS